jgi:hypothetical protein
MKIEKLEHESNINKKIIKKEWKQDLKQTKGNIVKHIFYNFFFF